MKQLTLSILLIYSIHTAYAQQQEKSMILSTNYLLYVPKTVPKSGKHPLMLFLHGSGERGANLNMLKKNGPPSFLDSTSNFPFIVVSPQCPANRNWDTQNLLALLDHIEATLPVDKQRIYVTGLSMGGFGTWALAQAAPERFAAIAPICGGGNLERLCIMRDVPVWAFHGAKDNVVPSDESQRLVDQLKKFGSEVKFTLYPDAAHNSWTEAYKNQELYTWLLSKTNAKEQLAVKNRVLKSYAGLYKYSDTENMEVTYEKGQLYVQSTVANRKVLIEPLTNTKFRIAGPLSADGDMYFDVAEDGKVRGFTVGPCDHTYCPSID
jgi:predicted esterase